MLLKAAQFLLPSCENCSHPSRHLFCPGCLAKLKFKEACGSCGHFPLEAGREICLPCEKGDLHPSFDRAYFSFKYEGGVITWLQDIKMKKHPERTRELRKEHLPRLGEAYSAIIYASSDPLETRKRGFDSTALLARRLGWLWNLPVLESVFERKPFLQPQKLLDRKTRSKYLKQTVHLHPNFMTQKFKSLLFVDDVMTTGATVEVHTSLIRKWSKRLDVFCLARTLKSS